MEKKNRLKKVFVVILSFIGVFILGGLITYGVLSLVSKNDYKKSDSLISKNFTISDVSNAYDTKDYTIENINISLSEALVRADKNIIDKVSFIKPEIVIDDTKIVESGIYKFDAVLRAYDANNNLIKDVQIVPSSVKVEFDILTNSKKLPIEVFTDGVPVDGRTISSMKINGKDIDDYIFIVYGNPETLAELESVPVTINVDNTGYEDFKVFNVNLKLPVGVTDISERNIQITVEYANSVKKDIVISDISVTNLKEGLQVNRGPEDLVVTIEGTEDVIDKITEKDIEAYIDLQDYDEGQYEVEVYLSSEYYFIYSVNNISIYIYGKEKEEL